MAKSKPIGVRFDLTKTADIMMATKIMSYQKVLDYLMNFYLNHSVECRQEVESKMITIKAEPTPALIAKTTKDTPPERLEGESAFDFAFRKNEWKRLKSLIYSLIYSQ